MIVIKHGELMAEAEMEEDLQNYLKMNTYLDSADPWFWPKLRFVADKMGIKVTTILSRYTLPHRRKVSAIGERVFWSTLNKVKFFHNEFECHMYSSLCGIHSIVSRCSPTPGVPSVLKTRL